MRRILGRFWIAMFAGSKGRAPLPSSRRRTRGAAHERPLVDLATVRGLVALTTLLWAGRAQAGSCPIPSGAASDAIVSTIEKCGSGDTVTFAAGTFAIASGISVPCGVSIAGPEVPLTPVLSDGYVHLLYEPKAVLNFSLPGSTPAFHYGACSTASTFEYLEVNMQTPSPDGGQAIYLSNAGGVNNLTISYNYFHGNQANASNPGQQDSLIWIDGNSSAPTDENVTISWNRFGASGDCSNVMSSLSYSGFSGDGGQCAATGFHTNMNKFVWSNNFVYFQEEGLKGYESQGNCLDCSFEYNDFSNIHRIAIETQTGLPLGSGPGATRITYAYNSLHDPFTPGNGTFGISSANGCDNTSPPSGKCTTIDDFNVVIDNVAASPGAPFNGLGIEFWSGSSSSEANYNLVQGQWSNSFMIAEDGDLSASHNHIQSAYGAGGNNTPSDCYPGYAGAFGWWAVEDGPVNTASGSGNTCDFVFGSTQTSAAPKISPPGGSFSGSQTWVVKNTGADRDANTGEWCTTDGSDPVPGGGTAKYYVSGTGGRVTATTTVKCVGMWGAANQPASYAATFGYGPSAVVVAAYVDDGPPLDAGLKDAGSSDATTGKDGQISHDSDAGSDKDAGHGATMDGAGAGSTGGCACVAAGREPKLDGVAVFTAGLLAGTVVRRRKGRRALRPT